MNELEEKLNIKEMIYEIKGKRVMLDSDLAKLYQCKNGAKEINQAVKNNIDKFPERYCFRITENDYISLKSKILTSKGGSRKGHTVFTEQGIYMLATILKSKIATEVTINIMDTFVMMKEYISNSVIENKILINHENRLLMLEENFNKKIEKERVNSIFFEGQIYDAYSLLLDILNKASEEIIIIDNYASKELLDILKNINTKIIIVSKNIDNNLKDKYESQYDNITFISNNSFHDRFIIIDRKVLYSCGASFKDLGNKCFAINENSKKEYINELLKIIM